MAEPQFLLPVTGSDPKLTSKQLLEGAVQAVIDALYAEFGAIATGTQPAGEWSPASGAFPSGSTVGTYYLVAGSGSVDGNTFAPGDWLIPLQDGASTTAYANNWATGRYSQVLDGADGRAFVTQGALVSATDLAEGQSVVIPEGIYRTVAAASYASNGSTVIDLTGSGLQAVLAPNEPLDSFDALEADTRGALSQGLIVALRNGGSYEVASPAATDQHVTTAGGIKLYEAGPLFTARDRLVAAVSRGLTFIPGARVSAGDLGFIFRNDGSTAIGDLPGWHPVAPVHPEHFGALADGVNDDSAALQTAADYAPSASDKTLHFRDRVYTGCFVAPSNVTLRGAGVEKTVIKRPAGVFDHVINAADGVSRLTIEDMTVDGNRVADAVGGAGVHCVRTKGAKTFSMRRVILKNGRYYGYGEQGGSTAVASSLRLEDVRVTDCGGYSTEGASFGDGIDVKAVVDMKMVRVSASSSAQKGIDIRGERVIYDTCEARNNGSDGMTIRGTDAVTVDAEFKTCTAYGNGSAGISIDADAGMTGIGYVTVQGGVFDSNTAHGISCGVANISTLINAARTTLNGGSGVRLLSADANVGGCLLSGNGSYGFDNGGGNLKHVVVGNQARGNTAGQIRTGGANSLHVSNLEA